MGAALSLVAVDRLPDRVQDLPLGGRRGQLRLVILQFLVGNGRFQKGDLHVQRGDTLLHLRNHGVGHGSIVFDVHPVAARAQMALYNRSAHYPVATSISSKPTLTAQEMTFASIVSSPIVTVSPGRTVKFGLHR